MPIPSHVKRIAAFALPAVLITACDVAYPVAVIGDEGEIFRGTASNTFVEGGTFHVTNGKSTCIGRFNQHSEIRTVGFPVTCSNGMKGVGTAHFSSHVSGTGIVTMDDGRRWQFIFGRETGLI